MDDILRLLGCPEPFDRDGELTADGADKYERLIKIISKLFEIGAIVETLDKLESYFNEICRLGF